MASLSDALEGAAAAEEFEPEEGLGDDREQPPSRRGRAGCAGPGGAQRYRGGPPPTAAEPPKGSACTDATQIRSNCSCLP